MERYSVQTLSLLTFMAAALWGLLWVPLRILGDIGLEGPWGVALFNLCPLFILCPLFMRQPGLRKQQLYQALLIGALSGVGLSFYATGLVVSSVIRTTMLFYLTPVWSTLLGYFFLSEPLTRNRIMAIVLGVVGLLLLLSGHENASLPFNLGDLLALLSGLFWGIAACCLKRWPDIPVIATATSQFFFAAGASLLLGWLTFDGAMPQLHSVIAALPIAIIASIVFLVPSVAFIFWVSKRLFPARVAILMMSEVLVAVLSASLFLPSELLRPLQWVGTLLIILACICEVMPTRNHHIDDSDSGARAGKSDKAETEVETKGANV